jgi:hypothetical protein
MNVKVFDNLARRETFLRADCRCEICAANAVSGVPVGGGGSECGNEVLEDHHIISRRHLLTRWAAWNHIVCGRKHHERADLIREWVRMNRPWAWRRLRRAEMRLAKGGYKERNMKPARVRARIMRFGKVLQTV